MGFLDTSTPSSMATASLPKTYRQPRRRPAHLRTKTGCLTCRTRKKKCDEARAPCLNCTKRNVECVWRPLLSPQGPVSPSENTTIHSNSLQKESEQTAMEYESGIRPTSTSDFYTAHNVESILRMPFTYSAAITSQSTTLFDFLRQKFLPELIRPMAETNVIDALSKETLILALDWPFCMHALLACCGAEIPTHDGGFRQLARTHYTQSVAALRWHLNDQILQNHWVATTLTVMMLCIYERSNPHGSPGVSVHLAGAARLIQVGSSGHSESSRATKMEQAMHRLVRESFIFHVATSLPFQDDQRHQNEIEAAFQLAEEAILHHFCAEDLSYSTSPVLGFPPKLFRSIYTAYRLFQESQIGPVCFETCRNLEYDLRGWSDHIESLESRLEVSSGSVTQNGTNDLAVLQANRHLPSSAALLGPKLYVLGCRFILLRISLVEGVGPRGLEDLKQEGMRAVRDLQPGHDYFAEYYCWPLLVIGMHLTAQSDKDLIMEQVRAFWNATNNGTMRRLADMLTLYWSSP